MKVIYLNLDSEEEAGIKEIEVEFLNWAKGANIPYLQVLKSAAGYYIGYLSKADWAPEEFWEPYSRDSQCYWATREEAEQALTTGNYPVKF
jgi:hypothetical protein